MAGRAGSWLTSPILGVTGSWVSLGLHPEPGGWVGGRQDRAWSRSRKELMINPPAVLGLPLVTGPRRREEVGQEAGGGGRC